MHDNQCCGQLCCLQSLLDRGLIPSFPKFHIGQRVDSRYDDEFGVEWVDSGVILGFYLGDYSEIEGWWYQIAWDSIPALPSFPLPHIEPSYEDALCPSSLVERSPIGGL